MNRLRSRLAALERRRAPGDRVYVVHFNTTGMTRHEVIAKEATRRRAKGDVRPFTLAPHFAVMPEIAESTEAWLAAVAAMDLK